MKDFYDFNLKYYEEVIKYLSKRYSFISAREIHSAGPWTCFLRHDVDVDIKGSLNIARLEHANGIRSSYYFLIRSDYYNIFLVESRNIIREIASLGHEIGLHFHSGYLIKSNNRSFVKQLNKERKIFKLEIGIEVNSFTIHNPNESTAKLTELIYGGIINASNPLIVNKFKYCSDSNGYWRFKPFKEFIEENYGAPLMLLTHPIWWNSYNTSPKERLFDFINNQAFGLINNYISEMQKHNREILDWNHDKG